MAGAAQGLQGLRAGAQLAAAGGGGEGGCGGSGSSSWRGGGGGGVRALWRGVGQAATVWAVQDGAVLRVEMSDEALPGAQGGVQGQRRGGGFRCRALNTGRDDCVALWLVGMKRWSSVGLLVT